MFLETLCIRIARAHQRSAAEKSSGCGRQWGHADRWPWATFSGSRRRKAADTSRRSSSTSYDPVVIEMVAAELQLLLDARIVDVVDRRSGYSTARCWSVVLANESRVFVKVAEDDEAIGAKSK